MPRTAEPIRYAIYNCPTNLNPTRPINLARRVLRLHSVVKSALLAADVGNDSLTSVMPW